jgi:hypothetical protein
VALLWSTRNEGVAASVSKRRRQGSHVHVQEDNASVPTENLPSWYVELLYVVLWFILCLDCSHTL